MSKINWGVKEKHTCRFWREGWALFGNRIERLDMRDVFGDDEGAVLYVRGLAEIGDPVAIAALAIHDAHDEDGQPLAILGAGKRTIDDVNVRLSVEVSFSITLGIYSGPITRRQVAEAIDRMMADDDGSYNFIDNYRVEGLADDDGNAWVEGCV